MNTYKKLIEQGKYQEAKEGLKSILLKEPLHKEALILTAHAEFKLKQYDKAIISYGLIINLWPNIADLYADRALCYHLKGEQNKALLDFDKAVELEPENGYRYASRAFIKDYYKDYEGALKDYKEAIKLDPNDAIAHNNKGVLEEKLGFAELAKESFTLSDELQGIDLDKELRKINSKHIPAITRAQKQQPKLSLKMYLSILKSVFTTKIGFKEFYKFISSKK